MRAALVLSVVVVALAPLAHLAHARLSAMAGARQEPLEETMPSTEALQRLSLGYKSFVADYYWLRAIGHFGDRRMHAHLYPNLEPFLRRTLTLDPYFAKAYAFAGVVLTVKGMDVAPAIELLRQGMRYRPDSWQIPFYLGFNLYYFMGDYAGGAEALAAAAKLPDAPAITAHLASTMAAEAGNPEVGLALVEHMLASTADDTLRAEYLRRRDLLRLELELRDLQRAVDKYREETQTLPPTLGALTEQGYLPPLRPDPTGGTYYLEPDGTVATTSEAQRLRLHGSPARHD